MNISHQRSKHCNGNNYTIILHITHTELKLNIYVVKILTLYYYLTKINDYTKVSHTIDCHIHYKCYKHNKHDVET
jgi:hypothetical protein